MKLFILHQLHSYYHLISKQFKDICFVHSSIILYMYFNFK